MATEAAVPSDETGDASSSSQPTTTPTKTPEEVMEDKARAASLKQEGNELYKKKAFKEALAKYDAAIEADPSDVTFRNNKCAVFFEMGDFAAVREEGRKAIEAGREHRADFQVLAKIYARMGRAATKQEDYDAAIEFYRSAQVEDFSKDVERTIKNLELERKKAKAAAYVDPEKAVQAKERGNGHFREGRFPEAIKEYEDAIKRDPSNPSLNNNLAAALSKIGDFQGAKRACERALELDPKYVKAMAKKGDIEFLMKEYHKALETYKKGLAIEPDNAACKAGLAKTTKAVNEGSSGGATSAEAQERARRAMADPEIQAILQDPAVRNVLNQLSTDSTAASRALDDPDMRAKIEKLVASGVLQTK